MQPYYDKDGITIYCGDAREVIPQIGPVDRVITDPVWPTCHAGFLAGSDDPHGLLRSSLQVIHEAKTIVICLGFTCDPRFLTAVPDRWTWIRSQQMPYAVPGYQGRLLGGDEVAYVFGQIPKGTGLIPGRLPTETRWKSQRANGHPCPRSLVHARALVKWWTASGDVLLDPFAGSGTTLVAGKLAGLRTIGIETDESYCKIAVKRLRQRILPMEAV
jgi:site-specific DNA-methyltransferase (adenine-specific)